MKPEHTKLYESCYVFKLKNGEVYKVPVKVILDDCANYYSDLHNSSFVGELESLLSSGDFKYDIYDWCCGNMDWEDIQPHATLLHRKESQDYQDMWSNHEDFQIVDCSETIKETP